MAVREPSGAMTEALLGGVPDANDNPSSRSQDRDHTAHRVAHLPAHVFFIIESKQNGHQSNARIASSCFQSGHVGHVYPSNHRSETTSPEQCHSPSPGVSNSCWLKAACGDLFLVCACLNRHGQCETLAISMKGAHLDDAICAYFVPI